MKDPRVYLLHALDCIERIHEYTQEGKLFFLQDTRTQDAVIRNLEVIGQCIKDYGVENLSKTAPEIPWMKIAGMRNILAHEYLGVDIELIWEIISQHISNAESSLKDLLA